MNTPFRIRTTRGAGMLILLLATALLPATGETSPSPGPERGGSDPPRLVEVGNSDRQWTGVAVSRSGRVFVNFPRWSDEVPISVGELEPDGTVRPYPNGDLNAWQPGEDPAARFVCVQSVHVDDRDRLWILDPANPRFTGVVEGGPKLIQIDLETDAIVRTYRFDAAIAPAASYLNDVRVDTRTGTAFITDSGLGAIVVVDLNSDRARRLLDGHASTQAEAFVPVIGDREIPLKVHADGIALDPDGGWLYYQALTGRTMYRVPTKALRKESFGHEKLAGRVETVAQSGVSDGLLFTPAGVYISALEEDAIKLVDRHGTVRLVIQDPRIAWPDSFAHGPDGAIYFTTSQIHLGPNPPSPYRVLKFGGAEAADGDRPGHHPDPAP
jgi:sugar lactone lactonase YvrE